jgi:hypothetical protein
MKNHNRFSVPLKRHVSGLVVSLSLVKSKQITQISFDLVSSFFALISLDHCKIPTSWPYFLQDAVGWLVGS